ncbi:germanicol synthase [Quercus suber]|uniref:Germanicol synthase n=1 Tax=Quercus suber TaxID=58331 RepID=A0AAW0M9R2_QUESU
MWKLKIAEGGNDPYIFSTNNFVGRQIWEFDPEAGSPEERAEVEEARQNFYKNRYQIKPSGDLLWRMQVPLNLYCLPFLCPYYSPSEKQHRWGGMDRFNVTGESN